MSTKPENLTIPELKDLLRTNHVAGYSGKSKDELVEMVKRLNLVKLPRAHPNPMWKHLAQFLEHRVVPTHTVVSDRAPLEHRLEQHEEYPNKESIETALRDYESELIYFLPHYTGHSSLFYGNTKPSPGAFQGSWSQI